MLKKLVVGLMMATAVSAPTWADEAPLDGFKEWAEQARKDWNIPGFAVAIVKDGKTIFAEGFGERSMKTGQPFKADTITQIGSTTKGYVALSLGILVDEGKLKWDDRVIDHMPEWRAKDPYVTRETTIRDILSHRTGYAPNDMPWFRGLAEDDSIKAMAHLPMKYSFRTTWDYNNLNFMLAGKIIERLSGMPLGEFIKTRVWQPLGMKDTFYHWDNFKDNPRRGDAHGRGKGEKPFPMPYSNIEAAAGAGFVNSTVVDHAKYLTLLLNHGKVGNQQIVSDAQIQQIFTPHTIMPEPLYPAAKMTGGHFFNYGLAWFVQDYEGRKLAMHTGSIGGLNAINAVMPEEGLAMVALFNRSTSELRHAVMYEILDRFTDGHSGKDWSGDIHKVYSAAWKAQEDGMDKFLASADKDSKPSLALESYTGSYHNDIGGDISIALKDGQLMVDMGPKLFFRLEHFQHDSFLAYETSQPAEAGIGGTALFSLKTDGSVEGVKISGLTFSKQAQ